MNIIRRTLIAGVVTLLLGLYWLKRKAVPGEHEFVLDRYFSAVIDTLVPADDAPGAIDLGIDRQLLEQVKLNSDYTVNITQALESLHQFAIEHYQRAFDRLSLELRTELLGTMLDSRNNEIDDARIQFVDLRLKTITRYYSSEDAFGMLDYHPPLQGGYPDYAAPPL